MEKAISAAEARELMIGNSKEEKKNIFDRIKHEAGVNKRGFLYIKYSEVSNEGLDGLRAIGYNIEHSEMPGGFDVIWKKQKNRNFKEKI